MGKIELWEFWHDLRAIKSARSGDLIGGKGEPFKYWRKIYAVENNN